MPMIPKPPMWISSPFPAHKQHPKGGQGRPKHSLYSWILFLPSIFLGHTVITQVMVLPLDSQNLFPPTGFTAGITPKPFSEPAKDPLCSSMVLPWLSSLFQVCTRSVTGPVVSVSPQSMLRGVKTQDL